MVNMFLFRFNCPYCKSKIKPEMGECPKCGHEIDSRDIEIMLTGKISDDQST